MAALLDEHFWESESTDSRFVQYDAKICDEKASTSRYKGKNENMRSERREANLMGSKASSSVRSTRHNTTNNDPCKVKTSALLYEITERVNRLAQPRFRICSLENTENRINVKKIPGASPRILELSRPKATYEPPSKPPGFVAPAALTALATERILQLSRPKKKSMKASSKRKKLIYSPCSPRILYLARAKNFSKPIFEDRGIPKHRKSERSYSATTKWKEFGYNVSSHRLQRNIPRERKRPRRVRSSNSDRTVITIDADYGSRSKRKVKTAHKSRNTFARSNTLKTKGHSN